MKFFIEMTPPKATAQQQKTAVIGGRVCKYDPKNLKQAKGELMLMLREFRPETPIDGALRVQIEWRYPFQKGHLTKSGNLKKGLFESLPCQTRPDVDNLQKALFDAMTKLGFWRDDSQIASVTFEKGFSRMPGIYVEIINCDYVFGALESSNF